MNSPKHLAIVPDGNRRCAKRLLEKPWKGHEWGMSKVKTLFVWSKDLDIETITYYALSLENLNKRPKRELDYLFRLAKKEIVDIVDNPDNFVHKDKVNVTFFGNLHLLPKDLQDLMGKAMEATKDYRNFNLNFAIAYGGRQEIIEACKNIAIAAADGSVNPKRINEAMIKHNLQTNGHGDPDLIIRTGGEKRLSNFLLFQAAYSELAFVDTLWPDFSRREFNRVIRDYAERDRRFGR